MEKWMNYCLQRKGARLEFPFGDEISVMFVGSKMFALFAIRNNQEQVNLKCDPKRVEALREEYPAIQPGYHMNKKHWNTVLLDNSLTEDEILSLIDHSYELVFKGLKKEEREQIARIEE